MTQDVYAGGAGGAALAVIANNTAKVDNKTNTTVKANGTKSGSNISTVAVRATETTNTKAASVSYGGALVAGVAASETNVTQKGTTTADIGGTWAAQGDVTISATNDEALQTSADTSSGGLVNGCGGELTTDVTKDAKVSVNGASITSGGSQNLSAVNKGADAATMASAGFGFFDSPDATRLHATQAYTGGVNFDGATLAADGDITIHAATEGSFATDNDLKATSAGVDESIANSTDKLTYKNSVKVKDSSVKTAPAKDGDITIAAYDKATVSDTMIADSEGLLAGATSAHLDTDLTRQNDVTIEGASTVQSGGDTNLYASRDTSGQASGTEATLTSQTYNRTFIPFTNSPDIDFTAKTGNIVNVLAGASVASVQNVNIAADKGSDKHDVTATKYVWYTDSDYDGDVTVKETGVENIGGAALVGKTTIAGDVTAGIHNTAVVDIKGEVTKKDDGTANLDGVTVTVEEGADWLSSDSFKKTIVEHTDEGGEAATNPFYEDYESLVKAQAAQPAGSDAREAIDAELASLCDRMVELGYAAKQEITDAGMTTTKYVVYKTVDMAAIEAPDLTVSGGNVSIDSDALDITGSLTANDASKIEITNRSNASLIVHDVIIPKSGGTVYFNSARLDADAKDAKNVTGVEHIKTSKNSDAPAITIRNTGKNDKDNLGHTPDIDVKGRVENEGGSITLQNTNGSIRLEPSSDVIGATVTIKADNGNVVQIDPDAKFSVAGEPIARWLGDTTNQENIERILHWAATERSESLKNLEYSSFDDLWDNAEHGLLALCKEYNEANGKNIELTKPDAAAFDEKNGIVAGGLVAISGHSVNINGLIQSGYSDYTVELSSEAIDAMNAMLKNGNLSWTLSDDEVRGNDKYLVQKGGAYYDADAKCYKYHVALYYNPGTDHIVASDVTAGGGSVYVKGNVVSTGNGRILVAAGTANIAIDTENSFRALALGTMENTNREGNIDIYDNFYRDAGQENHYHFNYKDYTEGKAYDTFSPYHNYNAGHISKYTWTGGVLSHETTHYTSKQDSWLFGSIKSDEEVIKKCKESDPEKITIAYKEDDPLTLQDFVQQADATAEVPSEEPYFTIATTVTEEQTDASPVQTHEDEKGLFGWIKTEYTYTWDEQATKGTSTVYAVNGAFDIQANAIRPSESAKSIDVHAFGDIIADHNITSAFDADGADNGVRLVSKEGSVTGSGTISTTDLTVSAADGIDLTHASLGADKAATITLATRTGDVSLDSKLGDVVLASATSEETDGKAAAVNIQTAGNLLNGRSDDAAAVSASRITLAVPNGSIGTGEKALAIDTKTHTSSTIPTPSVTASAYDGIYLTETAGDLPVNTVTSTTGDVRLETASGSITNVSDATVIDSAPSGTLIEKWKEAGLISSKDAADSNTYSSANALETRLHALEMRFRQLALLSQYSRKAAAQNGGDRSAVPERTAAGYIAAAKAYAADSELNAARDGCVAVLRQSSSTAAIAAAKASYKTAVADYFTRTGMTYSDAEKTAITNYGEALKTEHNVYGWTKNELMNALTAGIINRTPGTVSLPETANVTGKTVTLVAQGGGIGTTGGAKTIAKADLAKNMDLLRNVYAGGAVWNYNADGTLESVTVDTSRPLYVDSTDGTTTTVALASDGSTLLGTLAGKSLVVGAADASDTIGDAAHDMVLIAGNGIRTSGSATLAAKDLTLTAGADDIGDASSPLPATITGTLKANSGKSIYIDNSSDDASPLTLSAIAAGGDIVLTSDGDITMEKSGAGEKNSKDNTYLNAGDTLTLTSENGSVGTKNSAIRVRTGDATVSVSAAHGDAAIEGVGKDDLVLGGITAKRVTITNADGAVKLARSEEKDSSGNVVHAETHAGVTADSLTLAAEAIDLTGGSVTAKDTDGDTTTDGLTFRARDTITQNNTADSALHADSGIPITFRTGEAGAAGGAIAILSEKNTFDTVALEAADETQGLAGAVNVTTNAPEILTVTFGAGADGSGTLTAKGAEDFQIKNLSPDAALSIGGKLRTTGDMNFASNGDLTVLKDAELTSEKAMALTAAGDAGIQGTKKAAGDLTIHAGGDAIVGGDTEAADVTIAAGKQASVTGTTIAENELTITAKAGDATLGGKSSAKTATVTAGGDAAVDGIALATDVTITADHDATLSGAALGKDGEPVNVTIHAGDDATLNGLTKAAAVVMTSGKDTTVTGLAGVKEMTIDAGRNATIDGAIAAEEDLSVTADGDAKLDGLASAENVTVTAGGNAELTKNVTATNDVTITAGGAASVAGTTEAGNDLRVEAKTGNATLGGSVKATHDVTVTAGGAATISGDVEATQNDVTVTATTGDATLGGNVTAAHDVTVRAGADATIAGTTTAGNDLLVEATVGNATLTGTTGAKTATVHAGDNAALTGLAKVTDVTVAAERGDATLAGTALNGNDPVQDVTVTAGHDAKIDNLTTKAATITMTAGNDAAFSGHADTTDLSIDADNDATVTGNIDATNDATVRAGNNATITGNIDATNDATITATRGDATLGGTTTAKDIVVNAGSDATLAKDITATNDVTVTTTHGDITLNGTTTVKNVTTQAGNDANLNGDVTADENITVAAGKDANLTSTTTATDISVTAGGNATVKGKTQAADNLLVVATRGDATLGGAAAATTAAVKAGRDAAVTGLAVVEDVTIDAGRDAALSGAAVNGTGKVNNVSLTAGRDATIDGLITTANALAMTAGNDATFLGIASTKDMTIDAGHDATLGGLSGSQDVRVNAGDNISMDTGYDTFRTTGVLSLTAGNEIGLGTTKNLVAGTDLTLRAGGDVTLDSVSSAGNGDVLASSGGALTIQTIGNDTTKNVLAVGDTLVAETLQANNNVSALATHGMDIGRVTSGGNTTIDGIGAGDITVRSGDVQGEAYVRSNIAGDLAVSDFHSDGMARYTTRGGDMTLSNVSSDHRIGIWNYGRDKTTSVKDVKAANLISYLAFHLEINDSSDLDAPTVFNVLTAGDPARRAIGWRTAGDAHHHLLDAADAYRFRHDWQDIGTFLEYEPLVPFLGLPENAGEEEITIEEGKTL